VTDLDELSTLDAEPPAERPPGELGIGDRIADKYTIAGLLGSGGMGAVYLARTSGWRATSRSRSGSRDR
jgi:hypothetical protein